MSKIGIFDFAKKNKKVMLSKVIDLLDNGFSFWQINKKLTEIPEVRIAVNSIAEKVSMIPLHHSISTPKQSGILIQNANDDIDYVLNVRTNKYQTPHVFITNIVSRLLYQNNVFCLIEWDFEQGNLKSIYPLPFTQFKFAEKEGELYVDFQQIATAIPYSDLLHFQRFPVEKNGMKIQATDNYVQLVTSMQVQSVKNMQNSGKIKALLSTKVGLKDKDMRKKLEEFKANYLNAENVTGLGMISNEYEVVPVDLNVQALDEKLLNQITKRLYNYFGTSEEIISLKADELQYAQYIKNTIKPIAKQITEEMTFKLLTKEEINKNHRIFADYLGVEISTLSSKTAYYDKAIYGGYMTRNEVRAREGLCWVEGGDELLTNRNAIAVKEVNQLKGVSKDGKKNNI